MQHNTTPKNVLLTIYDFIKNEEQKGNLPEALANIIHALIRNKTLPSYEQMDEIMQPYPELFSKFMAECIESQFIYINMVPDITYDDAVLRFPLCSKIFFENLALKINIRHSIQELKHRFNLPSEYKSKQVEALTQEIKSNPTVLGMTLTKIRTVSDLEEFLGYLPDIKTEVMNYITANPHIFNEMICKFDQLINFINLFPEYKDEVFNKLIMNFPKLFSLVYKKDELNIFLKIYPNKTNELMMIFSSAYRPLEIARGVNELTDFITTFPEHEDIIFEKILATSVPKDIWDERIEMRVKAIRYNEDVIRNEKPNLNTFGRNNLILTETEFFQFTETFSARKKQILKKFILEQDSISRLFTEINRENQLSCSTFCIKFIDFFGINYKNILAEKLLSESQLFGDVIFSINDLNALIEIFPEYKNVLFDKLMSSIHNNPTGSMIACFLQKNCNHESIVDKLVALYPDKKHQIIYKVLGDSWYLVEMDNNKYGMSRIDSMSKKFPEYKNSFHLVYSIMKAIHDADLDTINEIYNAIKKECLDSNDLILISRALDKSNCKMMKDFLNHNYPIRTEDTKKGGEFIVAVKTLHNDLGKVFPNLFSFAASSAKQHGIFANKSECVVKLLVAKNEEIDCIYENNISAIKEGKTIILLKSSTDNNWYVMAKNHAGEPVCGDIDKHSELFIYLNKHEIELLNSVKNNKVFTKVTEYMGTNIPQNLRKENQATLGNMFG